MINEDLSQAGTAHESISISYRDLAGATIKEEGARLMSRASLIAQLWYELTSLTRHDDLTKIIRACENGSIFEW
jgi:hypothetical protein